MKCPNQSIRVGGKRGTSGRHEEVAGQDSEMGDSPYFFAKKRGDMMHD